MYTMKAMATLQLRMAIGKSLTVGSPPLPQPPSARRTEDDPDHDSTGAIMFRVLGTFLWADGTQCEQERWVPALDAG